MNIKQEKIEKMNAGIEDDKHVCVHVSCDTDCSISRFCDNLNWRHVLSGRPQHYCKNNGLCKCSAGRKMFAGKVVVLLGKDSITGESNLRYLLGFYKNFFLLKDATMIQMPGNCPLKDRLNMFILTLTSCVLELKSFAQS